VWRRSGGAAGTGAVRGGPLRPAFGNPGRVARSRGRPGGALFCADGRILVSLTIAQAGPFGVSIFWTPAERRVPARRDRRDSRGGLSLFPIESSRDVQPPVGRRPSAAWRDVCRLADRPLAGSNGPGWDAAGGAALSSHSAAQNAACGRAVGRSQRRGGTSGRYARHVCAAIDPLRLLYPKLPLRKEWGDGGNVGVGARPGHAPCRCWGDVVYPRRRALQCERRVERWDSLREETGR
jgi:hypothetical protein